MKYSPKKTYKRSMIPRANSLKRSTRLTNLLPDSSRKKLERTQIKSERGEITTDTKEILKII